MSIILNKRSISRFDVTDFSENLSVGVNFDSFSLPGSAKIQNLSYFGAALITSERIDAKKKKLTINISSSKFVPISITAELMWTRQDLSGVYVSGTRFTNTQSVRNFIKDILSVSPEFNRTAQWEAILGDAVCNKCILSNKVVGTSFDERGICNFCTDYEKKEAGAELVKNYALLEKKMVKTLTSGRRKSNYDCLCLYSGGKDSTYMLYKLVSQYKLRVLAFTFDNYFIAPETFTNMKKVLKRLNVDHILFKPSWEFNKHVFKTGFEMSDRMAESKELAYMIGHACWPCFTQISMHSIKLALSMGIPNIVVGTTPGQIRQKKYDMVSKFNGLVDVYKSMVRPMIRLLGATGQSETRDKLGMSIWNQIKALSMKLVPFYEYVHYNEAEVIATVKSQLGWESPTSTDSCSTNCQLNSLGIQVHKDKYGISPYVIPLARDVREGLVDRSEALKAVCSELNSKLVNGIAESFDIKLQGAGKN